MQSSEHCTDHTMSTSVAGLTGRPPPRPPSLSSSSAATALPSLQLDKEAELPPPSQNSIATWDYLFDPNAPLPPLLPPPPLSRVSSSSSSSSYFSTELLPPPPPPPPLMTLEPLRRIVSPSSSPSPSFSTELLPPPPPPPLVTLPPQPLWRGPSPSSSSSSFSTELLLPPPPPPFPLSPSSTTWRIIFSSEDAPEQLPSRWDYFGISTDPDTPPHTGGLQTSPRRPRPSSMYDSLVSDHRSGGSSQPASTESIAALATVTVSDAAAVCAVCTDAIQLASTASRLPCGHVYHSHCILQWLSLRNSCPVCRRSIPMFPPASTTEDTAPSPPTETDQEIAPSSPPFDPSPMAATDHRRRSLPGARRIRRICRRLLNYVEMSRPRQQTD